MFFNEEKYIFYLEKVHRIKNKFKHYKDVYKYFIEHGAKLDDAYFRIHYNIPEDFDLDTYNKRYNLVYTKEQMTETYIFYNESGKLLDDGYYRLYYNIPDEFQLDTYNTCYGTTFSKKDHKLAYKLFKNKNTRLNDTYYRMYYNIPDAFQAALYSKRYNLGYNAADDPNTLYRFYQKNHTAKPLDDLYYQQYYNIPAEFSLDVFNKRYGCAFTLDQHKEAYTFFTDNKTPLDETYYRMYYNIPDDFQAALYSKRYNLDYNLGYNVADDPNTLYRFYQKNQTAKPLDDLYYHLYYNIPAEFSLDAYNKRYGYAFTTNQHKEAYKCFRDNKTPLDEAYLKLHFKITDDKFVWTAYLKAYLHLFTIKSPTLSAFISNKDNSYHALEQCEGVNEDDTCTNVYRHYGNHEYKQISPNNEPYYRELYNLPADFNIEDYINSTPFIFKRDYYYVLDVYANKILLSDIYKEIIDKNVQSSHEINFLDNYEYLAHFSEITCEKDKRYYINLKDFVAAYNFNHKEIHKEIADVKIITAIEKMTEVKRVKNKKQLHKQLDIAYRTQLNNLLAYAKTLGITNESLPCPSTEIVIANTTPDVCKDEVCKDKDEVCDYEDEYVETYETIDVEVSKEVKTMRLEKYYDSLYCAGIAYDRFETVKTTAKNLYSIYSLKKYTDHLSNFPIIKNHPTIENTGIKNAIFFAFNNYPHISILFRNNIIKPIINRFCNQLFIIENIV